MQNQLRNTKFDGVLANTSIVIRDPEDKRFDLEAYLNVLAAENK